MQRCCGTAHSLQEVISRMNYSFKENNCNAAPLQHYTCCAASAEIFQKAPGIICFLPSYTEKPEVLVKSSHGLNPGNTYYYLDTGESLVCLLTRASQCEYAEATNANDWVVYKFYSHSFQIHNIFYGYI